MIQIRHRNITVLELEDGKIVRIVLPENSTKIVKKINSALSGNGINARVRKSRSHDVYRLYYDKRIFNLVEGKVVKINTPAQGELW